MLKGGSKRHGGAEGQAREGGLGVPLYRRLGILCPAEQAAPQLGQSRGGRYALQYAITCSPEVRVDAGLYLG